MQAKSKKILITQESHEIFVVRKNRQPSILKFCIECGNLVEMLNLDEAVSFAEMSAAEIIRLISLRHIHSVETNTGHLRICKKSLSDSP